MTCHAFLFFVLLTYAARGEQAEHITFRKPLTHLASLRSPNCPVSCFCSATLWNCDTANLATVPTGMPNTLMHLNFVNNAITEIPPNVFTKFPVLRSIDLRNNSITSIKANSFVDLPVTTTIYVSFNKVANIEVGAFKNLPELQRLRLDHNLIKKLLKNTFTLLPKLEEIRLRYNPQLIEVQPLTFNRLPKLRQIQMYRTLTNTTIFGTYDTGIAVSKTTFANGQDLTTDPAIPGCPELNYIELGTMKLHALYPNYFMSNNFLQIVRRIGQNFEIYSTDQEECDMFNKASIFSDTYGATVCSVAPSARLTDSPSRREKSHLDKSRL
jgi:hypothetical protein